MSFLQNLSTNEKSSVQVAVRIRPMNEREKNTDLITSVNSNTINITFDGKRKNFTFNYVYDMHTTQDMIYSDIGKQVVNNSFCGYNSCVFAYGESGTGKSHTMMGEFSSPEKVGLIPRVCQELFNRQLDNNGNDINQCEISYRIELSYLEIYLEEVKDLLTKSNPPGGLRVRQHPEYGPYVEGLTQLVVLDFKSIKRLIEQGNKERAMASTLLNSRSSRSHAILTIYFTQIVKDPSLGKPREIVSKLNLVDLAGSERNDFSGATGINLKEAININKSLSTLNLVISKLAAKVTKPPVVNRSSKPNTKRERTSSITEVIPFRDSVLTWILKESLDGNSRTYMIATVSPSAINYNESLNTLRYAYNANQIINTVKINEDPNDKIIKILKDEIVLLREKIKNANNTGNSAEIKRLEEELAQREELMRDKEKSWEQKLQEGKQIIQQIEEQYKKELAYKQAEFKRKTDLMNEERDLLLNEMNQMKSSMNDKELQQQKIVEEELLKAKQEYEKKQNDFEKGRIVETAVSLQEYYEKKLVTVQEANEKKIEQLKSTLQEEYNKSLAQIKTAQQADHSHNNNIQKQYTNDRSIMTRQIQQLQSKISSLEHQLENYSKLKDELCRLKHHLHDHEKLKHEINIIISKMIN